MNDDYRRFRDGFAAALDPDFFPIDYLDRIVAEGRALVMTTKRAGIVIEVRDYPGGARVIHGLVAAGELEEIAGTLIPIAEEWGRGVGCTHAEISSRPGWAKVLKDQGYEPHQLSVRKEL